MMHELDTVVLLNDVPEHGLKAGAEGIVMLTHDWARPQGLTIEFYTGDREWTPEGDDDYPAVTVSLPADYVWLVRPSTVRAYVRGRAAHHGLSFPGEHRKSVDARMPHWYTLPSRLLHGQQACVD